MKIMLNIILVSDDEISGSVGMKDVKANIYETPTNDTEEPC